MSWHRYLYTYFADEYSNLKYQKGFKKKRFYALYGLFRRVDGILHGFVEQSFSMSWSPEFVRGWLLKDAQSYYLECTKKYPNDEIFLYRLTKKSPNGNIFVDFKDRERILSKKDTNTKFNRRNIPFIELKTKRSREEVK